MSTVQSRDAFHRGRAGLSSRLPRARRGLAEIVERGVGVEEHAAPLLPHFERESMSFSENPPRHGNRFA